MRLYGIPEHKDDPLGDELRWHIEALDRHERRLDEIRSLLPQNFFESRRSVLDLGCGPGTFTIGLNRRNHVAFGIDTDPVKVALGHAHVREAALPSEFAQRIMLADGGVLTFAPEQFDLVTSYHVLEHVSDLRSILYEAVRVTKPNGFLHFQAPDYRYSYDTHYCMPWPRMMPPLQAASWCAAMGRPTGGIETIYRVTMPEVTAILEALNCTLQAVFLREVRDGQVFAHAGVIPEDPIIFHPDTDLGPIVEQLDAWKLAGTLPHIYKTCLEFTIVAQRKL